MVLVSSQKPLKDQFASFSTKRCIMGVVPVTHLNMKALNILIMNQRKQVNIELVDMWGIPIAGDEITRN